MKPIAWIALVVAIAAVLVLLTLSSEEGPPQLADPDLLEEQIAPPPAEEQPPAQGADLTGPEPEPVERSAERVSTAAPVIPSGVDFAQGVHGRVTDLAGTPVGGARVYLLKRPDNPIVAMQQAARGVKEPPLASAQTDGMGHFSLGVEAIDPKSSYDLAVISEHFVDGQKPRIKFQPGEWFQIDDIRLSRGLVVMGRVTHAAVAGAPIEGALVTLEPLGRVPRVSAAPERLQGYAATTDAGGYYTLSNIPRQGFFRVSAVAENFARQMLTRERIYKDRENVFDFALEEGLELTGVVTDGQGRPVAGAEVRVRALSRKRPGGDDVISDGKGQFKVLGLNSGPHGVSVVARNYELKHIRPVHPGVKDIHVVLETMQDAELRVLGANNRVIRRFRVEAKHSGPEWTGRITAAKGQKAIDVQPRDLVDDYYRVGGLDPGYYVFEVTADGYAKTFSQVFQIRNRGSDEAPPRIDVNLTRGGIITGRLLDASGSPVAGATVTSEPNFIREGEFFETFGDLAQTTITRTSTKTDGRGRYRFNSLSLGEYHFKAEHPDYVTGHLYNVEMSGEETVNAPDLILSQGVKVAGIARVDGRPASQLRIIFHAVVDPEDPDRLYYSAKGVSASNGYFQLDRRLPPGKYNINASRPSDNVFSELADEQRSHQVIDLSGTVGETFLNIDLPSR